MADANRVNQLPDVPSLQISELLSRLDRGDPLTLLDVRNHEEFSAWRLEARRPVETLHVPYFDFIEDAEAAASRVPRGREIVVLCAQGGSSELVVDMLNDRGVASKNVCGGMLAYGNYLQTAPVTLAADEARRFRLWQVNRRGKGCLGYVVRAGDEAVIVDPSRDVEFYERFSAQLGVRVVFVLDTHVHADHVSGGPALARRLAAPYFVAAGEGFELRQEATPLGDGERLRLGGVDGVTLEVRALRTPGHTPGSVAYLIDGRYLLSGDTLFVSSVGRPDLGGHLLEWGKALYQTLRECIAALGDDVVVLPAHSAGGHEIGPDGVVQGRLGELRSSVPQLQRDSEQAFLDALRSGIGTPPESYADIIRINLGQLEASPEQVGEWELGKNQCAAAPPGPAPRPATA